MAGTLQDLRHGFRLLARAPGFTVVVVLTLALGIGANTAIFSVVYALLLRPLPYQDPDRLVMVWQDLTARGGPDREWMTPGTFADLAIRPDIFDSVAAIRGWQPTLTGQGDPEPLTGEQVSHEYFTAARRRTGPRSDVHPRRRRAWCRASGDHLARALGPPVRQRPGDRRPVDVLGGDRTRSSA